MKVMLLVSVILFVIISVCCYFLSDWELKKLNSVSSMAEYRKRNIYSCIFQGLGIFLMLVASINLLIFVYLII